MATHKTEMLKLNGSAVQVLRGGGGPPLLYLHSAAGETTWLPFHQMLAEHFDVIAPAHPGFALSEGLDRVDSIEDWVIHYLDLLDLLKLESVDVVGLSLGGWLAAELATRNRERVRRLVLVDAAGLYIPGFDDFEFFRDPMTDPDYIPEIRKRVFYDPDSEIARLFVPDQIPFDQLLNHYKARQATARVAWNPYFYNPKLRGRLYRVNCPTLVLWGDSDGLLPLEFARAYHEAISGSKLQVLEKCGHAPPFEKPAEFVAAVRQFLAAGSEAAAGRAR